MSVYKWPITVEREEGKSWGVYYCARFRDPLLDGMLGIGQSIGEAIKDLKQVRREFVHWYEEDHDELGWRTWVTLTTNYRTAKRK